MNARIGTRLAVVAMLSVLVLAGWFTAAAVVDSFEFADAEGATTQAATRPSSDRDPNPSTGPAPPQLERERIQPGGSSGGPLTRLVRVRGRVLDRTGPLTGARVGPADMRDPPAETDDGGRFDLAVYTDDRLVTLLVRAPQHGVSLSTHDLVEDTDPLEVGDIVLGRGGSIRGWIQDSMGQAFSGATTTVYPTSSNPLSRSTELAALVPSAASNADGGFRLLHLMPGRYRVVARAPGMRDTRAASSVDVKEGVEAEIAPIRLTAGFELAGSVLGPGDAPIAGAALRVRNGSNQEWFDARTTTGDDGRFQMNGLPPGRLRLYVTAQGYLGLTRSDLDATTGEELVVRLDAGLIVLGTFLDADSDSPVEVFAASVRRVGALDPGNLGDVRRQLRRKIDGLRAAAADPAAPAEERRWREAAAGALEARLTRVREDERTRPVAIPADTGALTRHPGGRFEFRGLDEGWYVVEVLSANHRFARSRPVEVRRGAKPPDVTIESSRGHTLRGSVLTKRDRTPVAGAIVHLMRTVPVSQKRQDWRRSLYPWAFAGGGPQAVSIMAVRTGSDGRFEFRQAPPGRFFLAIRHHETADHDSAVFYVRADAAERRVLVGARASLRGRVRGIPRGEKNVQVFVLGGHGTTQTVPARADGTYRIERLQPGSYIVRAFAADRRRYVRRLMATVFAPGPAVADPEETVQRDVTLLQGEDRTLDLTLDDPRVGIVAGTVLINGRPGEGSAYVRPLPGAAPGSGGLSQRAAFDAQGNFTMREVPAGKYTLRLYGPTRQELHTAAITVRPGETTTVREDLACGGLRGRITTSEGLPAEQIRGYVWVLPGADSLPADLRAYRRAHRTHRVRIRDGAFRDEGLTPGPALLVVDVRDRHPAASRIAVPTGTTLDLELASGPAR